MNKTKEEVLDELKICLKGDCEECDFESDCNKNIAGEELIFKNVVELLERYEKMSNRPTNTENDLELAHTKGMEDACDILNRINKPRTYKEICDMYKHFGISEFHQILEEFTPLEAKAKFEAWEESKNICVGSQMINKETGEKSVVVMIHPEGIEIFRPGKGFQIIWNGNISKPFVPTGKHIDLDGLFKQIGE